MYFVYILASQKNGTLYIGITNNLIKRVWEHKNNFIKGFTKRYHVHVLVYFEEYSSIEDALVREKQIKWWKREWKARLIEERNPNWNDLYETII